MVLDTAPIRAAVRASRAPLTLLFLLLTVACNPGAGDGRTPAGDGTGSGDIGGASEAARPRVVVTTGILGEVARAVAGDRVDLRVLMAPDADPHAYPPTPADMAALERADRILVSGFDLEESLLPALESLPAGRVVSASAGIQPLELDAVAERRDESEEDDAAEDDEHAEQDHHASDPHVWLDPHNVMRWARTIAEVLIELDPEGADGYRARSEAYVAELEALDDWIVARVAELPAARRLLVSDHQSLGWFARRYGFEQAGTLLPSFSSAAEPAAGQLARLETRITELGLPAIFVSASANRVLSQRVADDLGVDLVPLYIGALSGPEGPAATYVAMMRYNVESIVDALARGARDAPRP